MLWNIYVKKREIKKNILDFLLNLILICYIDYFEKKKDCIVIWLIDIWEGFLYIWFFNFLYILVNFLNFIEEIF